MGRSIYALAMIFLAYVLIEGDPLMALLLMGYATKVAFISRSAQLKAVPLQNVQCNCLSHRLVGRFKMAA